MKPIHITQSIRSRLLFVTVVLQLVILAVLLSNSVRLINQNTEIELKTRTAEIEPLLNASLSSLLFNRDFARLKDTMEQLISNDGDDGLKGLKVYTPEGELYAQIGKDFGPQAEVLKSFKDISHDEPYYYAHSILYLGDIVVGNVSYVISVESDLNIKQEMLRQGMGLTAFLIILSIVFLSLISHWLLGSLNKLLQASSRLESGQSGVAVNITSNDEIGLLGESFNKMSQSIDLRNKVLTQEIEDHKQTVHALWASEAHLRTVIESSPDLIWLKDPEGIYLSCNRRFEEFFGATEAEILGKTDYDFVSKELADFFRQKDLAAVKAGKPTINEEEVTYASDGHIELLETIKTPMYTDEGEFIGVLGIGRDITERRNIEKALRRAQKMDAVGELSGGIAHDFNNILGIIQGNLDLLGRKVKSDDDLIGRVEIIQKSVTRAGNLTRQLLGFSKRQSTQAKTCDLNHEIEEMQSLIDRSLTPQVEFVRELEQGLWPCKLDPGEFQDALLNLILNARDAMNGPGRLIIETRNCHIDQLYANLDPELEAGDYVQLSLSDDGEGIAFEVQERIFEPFFTTKESGKGTGLGLAMVYGFVKRSMGDIRVYSEPSVGTTFKMYFPKAQVSGEHGDNANVIDEPIPLGNETILVVDDEQGLLDLAQQGLELLGYQVITAENGRQALAQLETSQHIDLVFCDVVMPGGINGYDVAEQALSMRPDIKVLLTSGYTEKVIANNSRATEQYHLLSKPYSQDLLAREIRTVLGTKQHAERALENQPKKAEEAPKKPIIISYPNSPYGDFSGPHYKSRSSHLQTEVRFNITVLDDDHERIQHTILNCKEHIKGKEKKPGLHCFEQLKDIAARHFQLEEALMEKLQYPGKHNHAQVHQFLIKQIDKLYHEHSLGRLDCTDVEVFMDNWWLEHLHGLDASFADYCKDKPEAVEFAIHALGFEDS